MLINCPECAARVDGRVLRFLPVCRGDEDTVFDGYQVSLLQCPSCSGPLVGKQELLEHYERQFDSATWGEAKRVWPNPESVFDASISNNVQVSLSEANGCLSGGNYTASVVMSGRALEAVARHFHVGGKTDRLMLAKGLQELHGSGKIDERLYQWGKELHEHRNLAAHASERTFSKEDAEQRCSSSAFRDAHVTPFRLSSSSELRQRLSSVFCSP